MGGGEDVTGGPQRDASPDEHDGDEAAEWEWAREWAQRSPDWSDEQWRRINAGLGYRVGTRNRQGRKGRDSPVAMA